ncbi:MAG: hypothetical protein MZV70_66110 [Desulfobacterales bacterium]|nr:hypothetical protein [Desulfobacterales bacterium]
MKSRRPTKGNQRRRKPSAWGCDLRFRRERGRRKSWPRRSGDSGFETLVRAYETDDGRTVYGVFVIVHEESAERSRPGPTRDCLPGW